MESVAWRQVNEFLTEDITSLALSYERMMQCTIVIFRITPPISNNFKSGHMAISLSLNIESVPVRLLAKQEG